MPCACCVCKARGDRCVRKSLKSTVAGCEDGMMVEVDCCADALVARLERLGSRNPVKVVLLPDFYLDHFVLFEKTTFPKFVEVGDPMVRRGGGSIPFVPHKIMRGGNSANCASALAALGVNVSLIVRTSELGLQLLQKFLPDGAVDISRVKTDGRLATTVALEFKKVDGNGMANIMIEDCGSVSDFDFEKLDEGDLELVRNADYVGVFNWSQNLLANNLLEGVAEAVKDTKARLFFDSGDPSQRMEDVPGLLSFLEDPSRGKIASFSMNENEAVLFASHYAPGIRSRSECISKDTALRALRILGEKLGTGCERLDLHTAAFSASLGKGGLVECPTARITPLRATGAGDAFNAGNILGDSLGFSDAERLALANAVANSYLVGESGAHATLADVLNSLCEHGIPQSSQ